VITQAAGLQPTGEAAHADGVRRGLDPAVAGDVDVGRGRAAACGTYNQESHQERACVLDRHRSDHAGTAVIVGQLSVVCAQPGLLKTRRPALALYLCTAEIAISLPAGAKRQSTCTLRSIAAAHQQKLAGMARNVLALILAIACMHAAHAQNATERTITVTGNGLLQRQSDTATVRPPVG